MPGRDVFDFVPALRPYAARLGATAINLKTLVVYDKKPGAKYKSDKATIKLELIPEPKVIAPKGYEPREDELKAILDDLSKAVFPSSTVVSSLDVFPPEVREAAEENRFTFRDPARGGGIDYVQVR